MELWSGLVSDQFFFNHSFFYPFAGAGDSGAVTLQDPRFFSENAGKEIRFSLDRGETFHNTGVLLPSLAGDGRRSSSPANLENLPTQEEVLK